MSKVNPCPEIPYYIKMSIHYFSENYINGKEFVSLSEQEIRSMVTPIGLVRKILRLLPQHQVYICNSASYILEYTYQNNHAIHLYQDGRAIHHYQDVLLHFSQCAVRYLGMMK